MAVEQGGSNITLVAAEALTIHRFAFVDSAGLAAETNDETDVIGVVQETVAIGIAVPVMTQPGAVVLVEADGVHAAGALISAGAAGQAVAAGAAGELTAGQVLVASANAGDIIPIVFGIKRVPA